MQRVLGCESESRAFSLQRQLDKKAGCIERGLRARELVGPAAATRMSRHGDFLSPKK